LPSRRHHFAIFIIKFTVENLKFAIFIIKFTVKNIKFIFFIIKFDCRDPSLCPRDGKIFYQKRNFFQQNGCFSIKKTNFYVFFNEKNTNNNKIHIFVVISNYKKYKIMATKQKKTTAESSANERILPQNELGEMIRQLEAMRAIFAPNSVTLSPDERRRLVSSSERNQGFSDSAYLSAAGHPQFLPSYVPLEKYTEDKEDFEHKRLLCAAIQNFEREVSDSLLVASDAYYHDSLAYYNSVKEAAKQRIAGAEGEYNRLKDYFAKTISPSAEPTEKELVSNFRSVLHGTKEGKVAVENEIPEVAKATLHVEDTAHKPTDTVDETVKEKVTQK
jgi:hypothetical protein